LKRNNLIDARKSKQMTQAELAEELGIAPITVRKLENSNRNPSTKTAMKIADYFELDIKVLFPDIFLPKNDTKRIKI
jgi:DNA-binding XRE family transcriptional regulator